jgi:hypothetical protein
MALMSLLEGEKDEVKGQVLGRLETPVAALVLCVAWCVGAKKRLMN